MEQDLPGENVSWHHTHWALSNWNTTPVDTSIYYELPGRKQHHAILLSIHWLRAQRWKGRVKQQSRSHWVVKKKQNENHGVTAAGWAKNTCFCGPACFSVYNVFHKLHLIDLPCALWGSQAHYSQFYRCGNRFREVNLPPTIWEFNSESHKCNHFSKFSESSLQAEQNVFIVNYSIVAFWHVVARPNFTLLELPNECQTCPACPLGLSRSLMRNEIH